MCIRDSLSPLNTVKFVLLAKEDPELFQHMLATARALLIQDWDAWVGQLTERHLELNRSLGPIRRFWLPELLRRETRFNAGGVYDMEYSVTTDFCNRETQERRCDLQNLGWEDPSSCKYFHKWWVPPPTGQGNTVPVQLPQGTRWVDKPNNKGRLEPICFESRA